MSLIFNERIAHLVRLADADAGRFVLALHSLIEELIREDSPPHAHVEGFADLLSSYRDRLGERGCAAADLAALSRIIEEHAIAERIRRSAGTMDSEEALAAVHNFLRFCAVRGIDAGALGPLRKLLDGWTEKHPPRTRSDELASVDFDLREAQRDNRKLVAQTEEWAKDKQRLAELEGESMRLEGERERERARPEYRPDRLEEIHAGLAELEREQRALSERLKLYTDLDRYVEQVSRFSLYTRTRMDYERGVMRLTPEQQEAVDAARPGHHFLVRGGAGTGKTIVLLHALQRALRTRGSELDLGPESKVLLLTYTATLVKYDRYVAEILERGDAADLIFTADSFFQSRLKMLGQRQRVDYGVVARLAEKLNSTGFFAAQELAVEIEDFIFGNLVTRKEYVEERIPRRGMRQPLSAAQRETVWGIRDTIVAEMEHDGLLSKNYSRLTLIRHLETHPEDARLRDLDVVFVDESQDLTAADLRALALMSRRGLIMAGDAGQSIYGVSSPYKRAGVDISGRSRVLHTSFRNTRAIQQAADAYRGLSGLDDEEGAGATAFREGPVPELYTAVTREELARLLLRKASLFIDRLGYDPENLTVLAPTKTDLVMIGDMLGHAGYRHANIRDEEFSFKEAKTIRLSTLHSSKGLDFAVVLLYLPALPPRGDYDDRASSALVRNLIYVAMTRAMDNLNVFTLEGAHDGQRDEPLQDLVRVIRGAAARSNGKGT
jgi:hypothetical protein